MPVAGTPTALFIPLTQGHHQGGVHIAEFAAKNAESEFVRRLAARMARNQRIEINELEGARAPSEPRGQRACPDPQRAKRPTRY